MAPWLVARRRACYAGPHPHPVKARSMPGRYNRTRFLKSMPSLAGAPPDRGYEVAFAGRSNAGKSSAINAVTGIGSLARTSPRRLG